MSGTATRPACPTEPPAKRARSEAPDSSRPGPPRAPSHAPTHGAMAAARRTPSSEPETDDERGDALFAFHSALSADVASGKTVREAVEALFDAVADESVPTANRARIRNLNLAAPVLAALASSPTLADDLRTVAQMCQTVYEFAEDEIDALRSPRERLDLKLDHIGDVAKLVNNAKSIVVLSGAGVSVSCGIPDFRSKGGLYDTVLERFGLTDPQAIFDLEEFKLDPKLFYSFAKDVMPSKDLKPSPTHNFVAELDRKGKLLRNYSQNIDGLEHRAGISENKVILCHGSFLTATCMRKTCRSRIPGSDIAGQVAAGTVPICQKCAPTRSGKSASDEEQSDDDDDDKDAESMGVLKPDIVFFGESLPRSVSDNLERDVAKADLVLVLGTSLQVAPVARIPQYFRNEVPRILVNRELVTYDFDVELLGDCDVVVRELRSALGWEDVDPKEDWVSSSEADVIDKANESEDVGTSTETVNPESANSSGDLSREDYVIKFRPPRRFLFPGAIEASKDPLDNKRIESHPESHSQDGDRSQVSPSSPIVPVSPK